MLSKVLAFGQVTPPGSSACETEACAGRKFCFLAYTGARRKHWHHNYDLRTEVAAIHQCISCSAFAQCLPQACAKACESPKTPSKASDASEWSATMACVGGTASAARLKRPKSSAQRGDGLRGRRHPQLGRAGEFAAQTRFPVRRGSDADRPSRFWTQSSTLATSRRRARVDQRAPRSAPTLNSP